MRTGSERTEADGRRLKFINMRAYAESIVPRLREHGELSYEAFREDILQPAMVEFDEVILNLDGVECYNTHAFVGEVFGKCCAHFGKDVLRQKLKVVCVERSWLLRSFEDMTGR